jgi:hypothetical protein
MKKRGFSTNQFDLLHVCDCYCKFPSPFNHHLDVEHYITEINGMFFYIQYSDGNKICPVNLKKVVYALNTALETEGLDQSV